MERNVIYDHSLATLFLEIFSLIINQSENTMIVLQIIYFRFIEKYDIALRKLKVSFRFNISKNN